MARIDEFCRRCLKVKMATDNNKNGTQSIPVGPDRPVTNIIWRKAAIISSIANVSSIAGGIILRSVIS